MSEAWSYERTSHGWEIPNENRLLVPFVPGLRHEREADAHKVTTSPD